MATILDLQVAASADDCFVNWSGTAWDLDLVRVSQMAGYATATDYKRGGGMRFLGVTIPKNAIINTAYFTLRSVGNDGVDTVKSKISGELVANAITFSYLTDYQARTQTTAHVHWDTIAHWTLGSDYNSPEIKTIIQEIVNQATWVPGNALVIFWDDFDDLSSHTSNARRRGYSYDQDTTYCAKLHIEFETFPAGYQHGSYYPHILAH